MPNILLSKTGSVQFMTGDEAIARGALEAGIGVAAGYPGTPISEIIGNLSNVAKECGIYAEWSTNEKVGLEVAAAASLAGVRSISAVKQNGLNFAMDFLMGLALTGTNKGLVLVVGDDPGAISTSNVADSRDVAKWLQIPCLEPASQQEAKDMTRWAFELSEQIGGVVLLRTVLRVCHGRGNVKLNDLRRPPQNAFADNSRCWWNYVGTVVKECQNALDENLEKVRRFFEKSNFNCYSGPENPDLIIFASGTGVPTSFEAVRNLSLEKSVGILKLGTVWPIPEKLITEQLLKTQKILFIEESFPFLESAVRELTSDLANPKKWQFFGKKTRHTAKFGELNEDIVTAAVADLTGKKIKPIRIESYKQKVEAMRQEWVPPRQLQFCAGCPHRGTYWALKEALKQDGREAYVTGDVGCYSMGIGGTGWHLTKTCHAMGSATGMASGLGTLVKLGFRQPVIATSGDSTFFHSSLPGLINGVANNSDFILVVFDNTATAMTGFQSHPGTGTNAVGDPVPKIDIEAVCRSLGVPVVVFDPYDIKDATGKFVQLLADGGKPRVAISRQLCALIRGRNSTGILYKMTINEEECKGCQVCVKEFKCPGIIWDKSTKKARFDEAMCIGCGVCTAVCKYEAIKSEEAHVK